MAKKKRGKLLDKKDLYITIHVGEAKDDKGNKYSMATMVDGSPVVTNENTDKRFNLSWQDIIEIAVEAGIDK
ncbi:hypothetical protein LCGC14_1401160 [marine sediment metagenome]|uniref:Uncharacterized protein n=1 Tax=marine sediment metagenome TaxID=412755 RepID=A0A0F9JXB8_9ZZZZ